MVPSTTGPTCASVITTAWYMESAAQTMNISAPRVRLLPPPNVPNILNIMRKFKPLDLDLILLAQMVNIETRQKAHLSNTVWKVCNVAVCVRHRNLV